MSTVKIITEDKANEFLEEYKSKWLPKNYEASLSSKTTSGEETWEINIHPVNNKRCNNMENIPLDGTYSFSMINRLIWCYEAGLEKGISTGAEIVVTKMIADKAKEIISTVTRHPSQITMSYDMMKLTTAEHLKNSIINKAE